MLEDLVARDAPIRDQLIQEADSLKFISLTEVCGRLFRFFFFWFLWSCSVNYAIWNLY